MKSCSRSSNSFLRTTACCLKTLWFCPKMVSKQLRTTTTTTKKMFFFSWTYYVHIQTLNYTMSFTTDECPEAWRRHLPVSIIKVSVPLFSALDVISEELQQITWHLKFLPVPVVKQRSLKAQDNKNLNMTVNHDI